MNMPSLNDTLASNLALLMESAGYTQASLAKLSGIGQTTISLYLNPSRRQPSKSGKIPSAKFGEVETLAKVLGVEPWDLLRPRDVAQPVATPQRPPSIVEQAHAIKDQASASNDDEYAYIDRLDVKLAAGYGKIVHHVEHKARLSFLRSWLHTQGIHDTERAVLVNIEGNSMDPALPDGATVLVDLSRKEVLSGHVYAFAQDGELFVKRLRQEGSRVCAHSDNRTIGADGKPVYKPLQLTESTTIIGRVFWVGAAVGERCV